MKDEIFVGIYDPSDVRRNLLESSREIIKSLQSHENLDKIRKEKLLMIHGLKRVMAELELLTSRLKQKLPKSYIRKAHEAARNYGKKSVMSTSEFSSELQKLENQLKSVEKELSTL